MQGGFSTRPHPNFRQAKNLTNRTTEGIMKPNTNQAILIADLGYGDAGKGSIVDYLTRQTQAHTVIRYNGGAQAAHNVITPEGSHHTFAQFGSGTFVPGTRTHLSKFMMLHPLAMLAEERHLQSLGIHDAFARLSIDRDALVTTPFQQAANRIKEIARGDGRHGSCGMGVGETMSDWLDHGSDVLFAGDLGDHAVTVRKLKRMREIKLSQLKPLLENARENKLITRELEPFHDETFIGTTADVYQYVSRQVKIVDVGYLKRLVNQPGTTIFEGSQGVLLDEWYGFYPYNSWSTLTYKNADTLLAENGFAGEIVKLGLIRGYATRHGAGPFVTEDEVLTTSLQDHHNGNNPWQREFRVGYLDFVALRYALKVTGKIDGLVVTNLDRMNTMEEWRYCNRYKAMEDPSLTEDFFQTDERGISDIKIPADPTNLGRQEALTSFLFTMRPVYSTCRKDEKAYLQLISQALGTPVLYTSHGPTALDKELYLYALNPLSDMVPELIGQFPAPTCR
jgi:adenylosuccinate synthase